MTIRNVLVLSCKRSTHHAFIESFLHDTFFTYENNVIYDNEKNRWSAAVKVENRKEGELDLLNVKSLEMQYDCALAVKQFKNYELIFFLRDPLNVMASLFSVKQKLSYSDSFLHENMLQFKRLFEYITENEQKYVYANSFWVCKKYRKRVSDEYDLNFCVTEDISTFARGGETFFVGDKITPEKLLSRVEVYYNNTDFLKFFEVYSPLIESFLNYQQDPIIEQKYYSLLSEK